MQRRPIFYGLMSVLGFALLALSACGPNLDGLEKGETAKVERANAGAAIELAGESDATGGDATRGVFLAEIGAPRRDTPYAENARADLEALAVGRDALLAYGGERVWTARPRDGDTEPPRSFAIAHVFVQSEGGRWIWLQHALVTHGAAWVRPRAGNHARIGELLEAEALARADKRGLWGERDYRVLSVAQAAALARETAANCTRGSAPYRLVEGEITRVDLGENRVSLAMQDGETPFTLVAFGDAFSTWDGPAFASLQGKRVIARGPLGVYRDAPQLCLEHASGLNVIEGAAPNRN
jgi:endonuclease YncB( thermonuclease family)